MLRCAAATLLLLGVTFHSPRPAAADEEGPCLDCHDRSLISEGGRSAHPPFEDGDCGACHLHHGDDERLVLADEGNGLCTGCHDPGEELTLAAHRNIGGEKASCLSCHDPHRSSLTTLLRQGRHRPLYYGKCDSCHRFDGRLHEREVKDLCLRCHGREEFTRSYAHAPVAGGRCLACHDPHGSTRPSLLLDGYTADRWSSGSREDYALCLGCHEADAFTASGEERKTHFRSGAVNIHALHIEGEEVAARTAPDRGLSCRNCHETHSSIYPKLIRQSLDCGDVPCLKLEFRTLTDGGECTVSCHGTKAYYWEGSPRQVREDAAPAPPPPAVQERVSISEPTALEKTINRRCRSCHEEDVLAFSRAFVHSPVRQGNCSACHLDHGPDKRLVLIDGEERLCGRCHDLQTERMTSRHRGYALRKARCSECHDPHASGKRSLLYPQEHEPFAERDCASCHDDPQRGWALGNSINEVCSRCHEEVLSETFVHSALPRRGCTGCHRPHGGEGEKFLRGGGEALCFLCHPSAPFRKQTVHSPVAKGDCLACHPPHGSKEPGLLAGPYPFGQYLDFRSGAYALCWKCHDSAIVEGEGAPETGFRTGPQSLHALHVGNNRTVSELGERTLPGLTCRNCHDPHSTDGPRLIRQELDCDGVPCLQLEYHKVGEGGRCLGGCHVRQSYLP